LVSDWSSAVCSSDLVGGGVVAELPLDDLAIALRQRRGGQVIREEDDGDGAEDEERRVPERDPQPERATGGGHTRLRARCARASSRRGDRSSRAAGSPARRGGWAGGRGG